MRRFWLKKGSRIWDLSSGDLSAAGAAFLYEPEGLGVKVKAESYEVERATFIESVKLETGEISGEIIFGGYAQFSAFAEFLGDVETDEPMRLYYSTADAQHKRRLSARPDA